MREKLNSNPLAQLAVVGVLLVAAGFMVLSSMGGGGEEAESSSTTSSATVVTPAGSASVTATVATPSSSVASSVTPTSLAGLPEVPAPPLPHRVTAAFAANHTVVLLIVKEGGFEDAQVAAIVRRLGVLHGVSSFVVPADKIARYAAITQGVKVERVPALIVIRPKHLDHGVPIASVSYGFQSLESIVQAVFDARYKGRTLNYHP